MRYCVRRRRGLWPSFVAAAALRLVWRRREFAVYIRWDFVSSLLSCGQVAATSGCVRCRPNSQTKNLLCRFYYKEIYWTSVRFSFFFFRFGCNLFRSFLLLSVRYTPRVPLGFTIVSSERVRRRIFRKKGRCISSDWNCLLWDINFCAVLPGAVKVVLSRSFELFAVVGLLPLRWNKRKDL